MGAFFAFSPVGNLLNKTVAPDGEVGDFFGISIALSESIAVSGAYGDDDVGIDGGSAYIFHCE